jgi:hypothetical protein
VEEDATGFAIVPWLASRVAHLEAGLPICGHKDCEIPHDDVVDAERIAAVIKRAENEAFDLLKANWHLVKHVVNVLCRRDQITSIEFEALMTGPKRPKKKPVSRQAARSGKAGDAGSSQHEQAEVSDALAS